MTSHQSLHTIQQQACHKGDSPIHKLTCGHYIRFDCSVECKANCSRLNLSGEFPLPPYTGPIYAPLFISCEGCILESFMQSVSHIYDPAFASLAETEEWICADGMKRAWLRNRLMSELGLLDRYANFLAERKEVVCERGGVLSMYIDVGYLVDEVVEEMKGSEIEKGAELGRLMAGYWVFRL